VKGHKTDRSAITDDVMRLLPDPTSATLGDRHPHAECRSFGFPVIVDGPDMDQKKVMLESTYGNSSPAEKKNQTGRAMAFRSPATAGGESEIPFMRGPARLRSRAAATDIRMAWIGLLPAIFTSSVKDHSHAFHGSVEIRIYGQINVAGFDLAPIRQFAITHE
jgi:hypothetical protein